MDLWVLSFGLVRKLIRTGSLPVGVVIFVSNPSHCKGLPGGSDEKKDDEDPYKEMAKQFGKEITLGAVTGFCSGYAMKKVAKAAAVGIGLFFIGIQILAYQGLITVPWAKVSKKFIETADLDGDGKVDEKDLLIVWKKVKEVLSHGIPNAGGFLVGFSLGLKMD